MGFSGILCPYIVYTVYLWESFASLSALLFSELPEIYQYTMATWICIDEEYLSGNMNNFECNRYAFPLAWNKEIAIDFISGEYLLPCFFLEWSFICILIKLATFLGNFCKASSRAFVSLAFFPCESLLIVVFNLLIFLF